MYRQLSVIVNPDLSKSGGHFLIIVHFFFISLPLHFLPISSMPTSASSVYFTIAYTIDTILSSYHTLIPWLTMRQNNCTPIWLGDIVGLEHTHGPSFHAQPSPMYGHICRISHFVKGFVIVMA